MAWINTLYQTYEANTQMAGKATEGVPFSLAAHMTVNAQIEVWVNPDGELCGACTVEKENAKTIIPVTESSVSRSSGAAPHALCDTLSYIAGDFSGYLSSPKETKKTEEEFEKHLAVLKDWAGSPFSHPKVRSIYEYAAKRGMTRDLILAKLSEAEGGKFSDKKVGGNVYEKTLVRFQVIGTQPNAVWQDESLFHSYIQYYVSSQLGERDLCYVTSEADMISVSHPKGIVVANYGAKLISANDTTNFTYRGRFSISAQVHTIRYAAAQKAHNTLTWLAARQGVTMGTQDKRTYICWNPNGKKIVDLEDPLGLEDDDEPRAYTEAEYKKHLLQTLEDYRNQLDNNDKIMVTGLDVATTGHLSVTYYNELKDSDFYDRLADWYGTCRWYFTRFTNDKKPYTTVQTPPNKQTVRCAFGTEQGASLETGGKLMEEQSQRVLYCMLGRQPLPRDITQAAVRCASTPRAYSIGNHERILSTACALVVKYYSDRGKGERINMAIDYENTDRGYLFGHLLAVLEQAEHSTFARGETRDTNVIRLQSAFINHPMSTWQILEDQLNPYFQRMIPGSRHFYKDLISEITEEIPESNPEQLNRPLGGLYLIGYYLQQAEFRKSRNQDKGNNREEE